MDTLEPRVIHAPAAGAFRLSCVADERRDDWDALAAAEPSFALLQSWDWGTFKERLGWRAVRVAAERDGRFLAGAQMLIKPAPLGLASLAYVPRGPIGTWLDKDVAGLLLDELDRIARNHRAVALRIEPPQLEGSGCADTLQAHGFRPARRTNQPRATIVVDLEEGSDRALARMHHKARYNIRRAPRQGVRVRIGGLEDLDTFHRLMRITGRRAGFRPRSLDYYRHQWETFAPTGRLRLFIASHDGEPLAANVSAIFGRHAAYLHGASSDLRRDLNPNDLLMWEAIRWAGSEGCRTFDLWGIPDEVGLAVSKGQEPPAPGRTGGLWGVYGFKRRLGQRVLLFTPAHDRLQLPLPRMITGPSP